MPGSPIKYNLLGFWTKPRHFNDLYLTLVYGHIYALLFIYNLVTYEYYKNKIPPDITNIDKVFFINFINYLKSNDLNGLLGF